MDRNQAAEELRAIREAMIGARRMLYHRGDGLIFVLWGCVWVVGFTGSQFLPPQVAGWLWGAVDIVGIVGTILVVLHSRRRVAHPLQRRLGIFWPTVFAYQFLLWWLLDLDYRQAALMLALTIGLAYVLLGLFTSLTVCLAGLAVSVAAVVAFLFLPAYFFLALAILGGGSLIFMGVWVLRSWGR